MNPRSRDPARATHPTVAGTSGDVARVCAPSFAQQALWVLCQVTPDEPVYNESNVFRVKGPLDVGALAKALDEIVRRHESLRARFPSADGVPVQEIVPSLMVTFPVGVPAPGEFTVTLN